MPSDSSCGDVRDAAQSGEEIVVHVGDDEGVHQREVARGLAGLHRGLDVGDVAAHQHHILAATNRAREHQFHVGSFQHGVGHGESRRNARQLDQPD